MNFFRVFTVLIVSVSTLVISSCAPRAKTQETKPVAMTPIDKSGYGFLPPAGWQALPQELIAKIPQNKAQANGSIDPVPIGGFSSNTEGLCVVSTFPEADMGKNRELSAYMQGLRDHFGKTSILKETQTTVSDLTAACLRIVDKESVVYKVVGARGSKVVFQIDYIISRDRYQGDVQQKILDSLSSIGPGVPRP